MSRKLKVMLVAFISLVSITACSFAEEVQAPASNSAAKPEVSAKETKAAKVNKHKKHAKAKKAKKDAKVNK